MHLHDTYFVVAHFHYVMFGGDPDRVPRRAALLVAEDVRADVQREAGAGSRLLLVFVGFNLTFFPQFVMGTQGMPRRYYNYLDRFQPYHVASSIGSYIMAVGFFLTAGYLLHSLFRGKQAPANPWGSNSLEWHTPSPPPHDNFDRTPEPGDPYDYSGLRWDPAVEGYVAAARTGA